MERAPGVLVVEDQWGRGNKARLTARLDAARREVALEGQWGYRATWRAEPDGSGTRLLVEGSVAPGGLLGLLMPLFRKGMLRQMRADFDGHLADLREGLGRG